MLISAINISLSNSLRKSSIPKFWLILIKLKFNGLMLSFLELFSFARKNCQNLKILRDEQNYFYLSGSMLARSLKENLKKIPNGT